MRDTLKRFTRMTVGYSLVTLLGPLFTILLTPLYTRVLTPADYGVVDVALTLGALISVFAIFGVDQALSAYFFDGPASFQRSLVTTGILLVGLIGASLGSVLALSATSVAEFLFKDPARRYIVYLLAIGLVSGPIYGVIVAGLRLQMGVRRVNILALSSLFSTIFTTVLFVLILQLKATGIVAANVVAGVWNCCFGLWIGLRTLRGRVQSHLMKPLMRTGASLLPGALGYLLLANVDRLLLTQYVSQTDIGLYSIANKLASMLWVLLGAAWIAWWPLALEMAHKPDAPYQYARMLEYFAAASMYLALGIGIFSPEILMVFTRDVYVPAAPYALVLMIATGPLALISGFFQIGPYVRKRTYLISIAYLLSAGLNILLNLWLNPLIGVWGAVWATVIAMLVLGMILYMMNQRLMPVSYRWSGVALMAVTYTVLVMLFLLTPAFTSWPIKVGALLLFPVVVFAARVVTPAQVRMVFQVVQRRVQHFLQR
jgi:O-antigen/teichoic acid export membrane protein